MKHCLLIIFCLGTTLTHYAQEAKPVLSTEAQHRFVKFVGARFAKLDGKLRSSTNKMLSKLRKQEFKIFQRLYKQDTAVANAFLASSRETFSSMTQRLNNCDGDTAIRLKLYLPSFDTFKTSLRFLSNLPGNAAYDEVLEGSRAALRRFEGRMQVANEIKRLVADRKRALVQQLGRFSMAREINHYSKTAYYYQQQLQEFRSLLKDRRKAERKAIQWLSGNERFKAFMKENSMLAQMFRVPDGQQAMQGLQNRQAINSMLLQRFAGVGGNPQAQLDQQISRAQNALGELKNKVTAARINNSGDMEMPTEFQPNTQRKKTILQRLEYGMNLQTQKINSYFPVTTDIAVSLGFKINDRSTIGVGLAYKLGLGKDWNDIRFTNEGIGLRSFVDLKLKGGLWLTGGYEQNQFSRIESYQQLAGIRQWDQSALLGLTRKISVGKKRTSKVQLLYDLFYQKNKANAQPVIFRIGYSL